MAAGAPEQPRQFWIRNDKGKMWGPLTFATIEILVDNGAIPGQLQASRNGLDFVYPGRLPELRDALPKELWGDSTDPLPDEGPVASSGRPPPPRVAAPVPQRPDAAAPPVVGKAGAAPAPKAAPAPAAAAPKPKAAAPVGDGKGVPASGSLEETPPFRLYYLAASSNQTGRLTLEGPSGRYEVFFKKGSPEGIKPSNEDEDLGQFLVNLGALNTEKLADARKLAPNFGGEIINALFGLQLINPADAFKYIGEHALDLLTRAFTLETGTFAFDPTAAPPANAMPLGDRWKIICDMVRTVPVDDVKARLGAKLDAPIMRSGGRVEITQLKLTPQETRAASYFDGVRSLNALIAALPNEADTIVRTAFLLYRFEACSFGEPSAPKAKPAAAPSPRVEAPNDEEPLELDLEKIGVKPEAPAPAKPAPARPPPPRAEPPKVAPRPGAAQPARPPPTVGGPPQGKGPNIAATNPGKPPVVGAKPGGPPVVGAKPARPGGPPVVAKPAAPAGSGPGNDLKALKAFWDGLEGKSFFEVLGVPETASGADVKRAYFQYAKWFHPDTAQGAPAEVGKLKAEIFARISEANGVLADDKSRQGYLEELKAGLDKMDASKIFASEELFQKACVLLRARKYLEALKGFNEAVALYDKEGEYYIWRGWTKFLAAADKKAAKADVLAEIDKGFGMSPRCALGPYFKGQIHKLLGDGVTAQKYFKETLAIDPNHLEAQREVRQR